VLKKSEKFYYVILMGTKADCRKQGLGSALIRHMQAIAGKEDCPIWLEATTEYSRDVYADLGFTMVEEILLGKGKVGSDGLAKKDGEGVKVWGMIWTPRDDSKDAMNQAKEERT
jgi:GNAT superfamily N-acetyltransferase